MVKVEEKKIKRKTKVSFCDRTLWSRFLAVLGIISSLVTLLSFFVTAADIEINVLYIAIPFLFGMVDCKMKLDI